MERTASTLLRWCGRIFILLAAFILVASLFLPDAVQPLGDAICPAGTQLDNSRYAIPGGPDNEKLELVCTSSSYTESAAQEVLIVVATLVIVGIVALWFSGRVVRPRTTRPDVPSMH